MFAGTHSGCRFQGANSGEYRSERQEAGADIMQRYYFLAKPRGYCFGVRRAVNKLNDLLRAKGGPIYIRREIVHNKILIDHYNAQGVTVVEEVSQVPEGQTVVFTPHGVAPSVKEEAKRRKLQVVDLTCPLVEKIHEEAVRLKQEGYTILLIGEKGHKEVVGVTGEAPERIRVIQSEEDIDQLENIDGEKVAWLSQTTLNIDDTRKIVDKLQKKYPKIKGPEGSGDICFETRDRQMAVRSFSGECDLFVVVGSKISSNTRRLTESALASGARQVLQIDYPSELDQVDLTAVQSIGVTSGAPVDEVQLKGITDHLEDLGYLFGGERGVKGSGGPQVS